MNIKVFLVTVLFLTGTGLLTEAQIIEGIVKSKTRTATNRAVYDANKEADSQINQGVDNQFNKLKGKVLNKDDKSKDGQTQTTEPATETNSDSKGKSSSNASDDAMSKALLGKMGINMTRPANLKDSYDYTGNIVMDVQSWNDEGESDGVVSYTTHYSDKNSSFAMVFKDKEKGNSTMIFDYDDQLMVILGDNGNDKSGMATPLGAYQPDSLYNSSNTQGTANAENYTSGFKKTGKSKTIAGYNCDEYFYENEEYTVSYWMTSDLPTDLWSKMYSSNAFTSLYTGRANGFVMESDQQQKNSKERSHMIVKEVNRKQSTSISTVGYNIMTMSVAPSAPEEEKKK